MIFTTDGFSPGILLLAVRVTDVRHLFALPYQRWIYRLQQKSRQYNTKPPVAYSHGGLTIVAVESVVHSCELFTYTDILPVNTFVRFVCVRVSCA